MSKLFRTVSIVSFLFAAAADSARSQLVANFTANPTTGCAPLDQVQFTDLSTGNPTSWLWNFGNGNTSALQNPAASYPNPGTYNVTLTVYSGAQSNSITLNSYITVFNNPVANFAYLPPDPCIGTPVTFTDLSAPGDAPVISWNWDFGDGNTLDTNAGTATHSYSISGLFPVSLVVTDTNGCSHDFDTVLTVTPKPVPAFSASPLFNCSAPATVNFTNASSGSGTITYLWKFGDGNTSASANPQHTYTVPGIYSVTLIVYQGNGCSDSIVKPAYIDVQPNAASFTVLDSVLCIYDSVLAVFSGSLPPVTWQWNFGDGTIVNDTTPGHFYSAPGTYIITLTATNSLGCTGTVTHTVIVHPAPVVYFGPNSIYTCSYPYQVTFVDSSTGGTSWSWNFGDGTSSTLQNPPPHVYSAPGYYTVTLIVYNSFGCYGVFTSFVYVWPPQAYLAFLPRKGCEPLTVSFGVNSSSFEPIINYIWNFGPGQGPPDTTAVASNSHTYLTAGVYPVSLIIETQSGCKDTVTDTVKVGYHVTPNFSVVEDTVCYKDTIHFIMNTPGANEWVWIFGDGGVDSTTLNPYYVYQNPGTYTVTLVACNNGCCDTLIVPNMITILPPKASFQALLNDCDDPYTFSITNGSVQSDSSVWNFGDGVIQTNNSNSFTYTYSALGNYTITLYTWNFNSSCQDSIAIPIAVTDPIAAFTATPLMGCYPLTVTFIDTSQDATEYHWDFGDGFDTLIYTTIISHTYADTGFYTVTLVIKDVHQCPDTVVKNQYVHVFGPHASFQTTDTAGCKPYTSQFTSNSPSYYPIVQYIWDFGDGTLDTLTTAGVVHTFNFSGTFSISLITIDSLGCSDTLIMPFFIDVTFPYPSLTVDTFACRDEVLIFNASASSVALPANFHWNFGDGTVYDTSANVVTHSYPANGNYLCSLTITDRNGCDSTINFNILIESPVANFYAVQNPSCGLNYVTFYNTSTGTALTGAYWTATDGWQSVLLDSATHNFTNPGIYSVSLVSYNAAGCTDTLTIDSLVIVPGPVGTFAFAPQSGCIPLTVNFTATSPNANYFTWDFGDGVVVVTTSPVISHTYTSPILAQPQLTLTSFLSNGDTCQIGVPNPDSVFAFLNADGFIAVNGDTSIWQIELSEGEQVILSVLSSITVSPIYQWIPSVGLSCDDCPNPTLTGGGQSMTYILIVTDTGGCMATDTLRIIFINCDEDFIVPNVFTPNNDGSNDDFFVKHACPDNFLIRIYNRWGQEIFQTSNPVEKWDGTASNGKIVPAGTYYWILSNRGKSKSGFVQLLK